MEVLSTVSSLNSILRIFGLSCTSRNHGQLKNSYFMFRVAFILIFLFLLNILSVYYKLFSNKHYSKVLTSGDYLDILFLFGYIQYVVDIYYVNKNGRQCYLKYMRVYEYVDKILGFTAYQSLTRSINIICAIFLIILFLCCIASYVIWAISYGWVYELIYVIEYIYRYLKLFSDLDYISNCTQVKYRLTTIGEKLQDFYYLINNLSGVHEDLVPYNFKKANKKKQSQIIFLNNSNVRLLQHVMKKSSKCYLFLIEQCDYINTVFGYRILVSCIHFLIEMVVLMSFIIRLIVGKVRLHHDYPYLIGILSAMHIILGCSIIFCGLHRCEQNYRQSERILNLIDHIQINKIIDREARDSLKELRHLIITRPINYHAANFFKVEYQTLVSVASIIVTYTILLVQYVKDD